MKLKLKQYVCKHQLSIIAELENSQQTLWQCDKCGVYSIQHYGIGLQYLSKTPHLKGWKYIK